MLDVVWLARTPSLPQCFKPHHQKNIIRKGLELTVWHLRDFCCTFKNVYLNLLNTHTYIYSLYFSWEGLNNLPQNTQVISSWAKIWIQMILQTKAHDWFPKKMILPLVGSFIVIRPSFMNLISREVERYMGQHGNGVGTVVSWETGDPK